MGLSLAPRLGAFFILLAGISTAAGQAPPPSASGSQARAVVAQLSAQELHKKGRDADDRGNYAEALRWYRMAAAGGLAESQYSLGNHYALGQGVPKDYVEALRWYRMAAYQGNVHAQYDVGAAYALGQGVAVDYVLSARAFLMAANQGLAGAEYAFGMQAEIGAGMPKDIQLAKSWYRRAAAQGNEPAIEALAKMGDVRPSPIPAIQFDQPTADEAATFDDLVLRTEHCMRNGALAMLRNGSRDREQIAAFQVRSCSGPLVRLMIAPHAPSCRNTVGGPCSSTSRETAVAFATAMAYEQLQRVMSSDR